MNANRKLASIAVLVSVGRHPVSGVPRYSRNDAPELALTGIRIAVLNDGIVHRIALQAPANGTLFHGPLDFRARFVHQALAPIGKPSNWTGDAYLSTGPVDLPTLARYANIRVTAYAGRIDNAIWAHFGDGHLYRAGGELRGYALALRGRPTQPRLDIPVARFGGDGAIDPKRDYTLHLSRLHAELGQPPLADGTPLSRALALHTLTARYRVPNVDEGQLLSVSGDRVDLGILAEFIRGLPLPARLRNELVRFDPRGLVANYAIEVERAKPASPEFVDEERRSGTAPIIRYRFQGDLQGISFEAQEPPPGLSPHGHPRAGIPGVENLWGHVDADEKGGAARFDTVDAAVTVPGVFDEPRLAFDKRRGRASWTITPAPGERHARVDVAVPEFRVENADAAIAVAGSYANPGHGRGSLDLKADFERAAVARITRYLPTSLSDHLRLYLGHALQAGQVTKGATIVAKGPLETFPYEHDPKAGVFHIVAPFAGGRFEPTPQPPRTLANGTPNVWPALDGIDGVFELEQNRLRFDIDRARYKDVALAKVTGRIDDLGNPTHSPLVIEGRAHGPLADLLDYANHSAIAGMTGHIGNLVRAQGPATLALKLTIPQHVAHPHVGVDGALGFAGNAIEADGVPPGTRLRGNVRFTQHTASVDRLTARFLGGDVRARGALSLEGDGRRRSRSGPRGARRGTRVSSASRLREGMHRRTRASARVRACGTCRCGGRARASTATNTDIDMNMNADGETAVGVVREFWRLMGTNDFHAVAAVLAEDFVLDWPQSNERIRGARNFAVLNSEYPAHGPWTFAIGRLVGGEGQAVSDVSVTDGVQQARAISFFTVVHRKITRIVEFWPEPYSAPYDRSHLVERID